MGERLKAHWAARPWTVKLYAAAVPGSLVLLFFEEVSFNDRGGPWLGLLFVWGVWMGYRLAWILSLAVTVVTLVVGLLAAGSAGALFILAFCAFWTALLVADPTRRWIDERNPGDPVAGPVHPRPPREEGLDRGWLRSEWAARPPTLRIFVSLAVAGTAYSLAVDPGSLSFWNVLFTLVFLGFLKGLWDGDRGMWWLFVIVTGMGVAAGLTRAVEEPSVLGGTALCAAALMLLVLDPTRSWIARRSGHSIP